MIRYYTNRDLSSLFRINLAKWKRWSREFLPPDPLGGRQSGYARQYTQDDAFTVYLAGHLVGDLRFTIPETKQILSDLSPWLQKTGFYENFPADTGTHRVAAYRIHIRPGSAPSDKKFSYVVWGIVSEKTVTMDGHVVEQVQYRKEVLTDRDRQEPCDDVGATQILNMTALFQRFFSRLKTVGNPAAMDSK